MSRSVGAVLLAGGGRRADGLAAPCGTRRATPEFDDVPRAGERGRVPRGVGAVHRLHIEIFGPLRVEPKGSAPAD